MKPKLRIQIQAMPQRFLLLLCLLLLPGLLAAQPVVYGYRVLNTFPHDAKAFTQGLLYKDGFLFEGTGRNGESRLGRRTLDSSELLQSVALSNRYFGEGIEIVGDRIFQLTWRSHIVFVYDRESLDQLATHYNATEGWGLAFNGNELILSDGTDTLQFIDPETFAPKRKIRVTLEDRPLPQLNELEFINGEIWANVWQTDFIVRIDPASGKVNSLVNLQGLSSQTAIPGPEAVLNGIAWDAENERLFVTGKLWAHLFEIELVEP